jgi:hypothetical protein
VRTFVLLVPHFYDRFVNAAQVLDAISSTKGFLSADELQDKVGRRSQSWAPDPCSYIRLFGMT